MVNQKLAWNSVVWCIDHRRSHYKFGIRGHGGRVVTLLPPTSEAGVRFTARLQVGRLAVACPWSAVYSTEPWKKECTGFLCPSNYCNL